MSFVNGHLCYSCDALYPAEPPIVGTCPACGGNLEVTYDVAAVRAVMTRERLAADDRRHVWRYEAYLPVAPGSLRPPLTVGCTPLYEARRLGKVVGHERLMLKDETRNPSASFKDRASAVALTKGLEMGARIMTGASTGNAGSSMACLAASMGLSPVIFVPEKAPRAKVAQLLLFGATVVAVRGTYDQAFDLCLEATRRYGWYNRNTGFNPYTREGKKTCAFEIAEGLGWDVPDVVAVSVGDGNIISGLWKGFRDLLAIGLVDRLPRMLAVQSSRSNAVAAALDAGLAAPGAVSATTLADSISVDLPRDGVAAMRAVRESEGFAVEVDDEEILAAIPLLARNSGVFGEPAGAAAVAGVAEAVRRGLLDPSWRVVAVVTGSGLKDVESALKAAGKPLAMDADPSALDAVAAKVAGA